MLQSWKTSKPKSVSFRNPKNYSSAMSITKTFKAISTQEYKNESKFYASELNVALSSAQIAAFVRSN
jgi:hypothetical protein